MDIKNVGQLINHLASKAGIPTDDANLKSILSNADLSRIPIHSDLVDAMDGKLINFDVAKDNHPEIGGYYKAQALGALDKRILAIAEDLNLSDEEMAELKKPVNSYKKLETVIAKLKETKKATPDKTDKDGVQKQIDELVEALRIEKEGRTSDKTSLENERMNDKRDYKLRTILSGRKTIFDTLDADVRHTSLMVALNKKLQELDAELRFDEKGDLMPIKKDGSKLLTANNTPINLQSLIDTTMAQNKFDVVTKVQESNTKDGDQKRTTIPGKTASIDGTNQSAANYNKQQREAYSKSTATQS